MFKRQVHNFQSGQAATLTLVFMSTMPVQIRWFRLAPHLNMPRSEVVNMLPLDGDPNFRLSKLSSGQVTATTVHVPYVRSDAFPYDFETIITSLDGVMQYQLRSDVREEEVYRLEDIDSPEWLTIPAPHVHFHQFHALKVHCKVFVPHEDPVPVNELMMIRSMLTPGTRDNSKHFPIDHQSVTYIHKGTPDFAEENGPTILQGIRRPLAYGRHVIYEVKLRTVNASRYFEGVYICALERKWDKLFVTSYVTPTGETSPFPSKPVVELVSCQKTNYRPSAAGNKVIFRPGHVTCIRCRGAGSPPPKVALYDEDDREILAAPDVAVSKYTNVADARVSEATYTFLRPSKATAGLYKCKATNENASGILSFRIQV